MKVDANTKANKILHELNFDKDRSTTQIIADGLIEYANEQFRQPPVSGSDCIQDWAKWYQKRYNLPSTNNAIKAANISAAAKLSLDTWEEASKHYR